MKNSPSLFSICLIICTVKLKKLIYWYKQLISSKSLVHIFLKPPIFVRTKNELNKVINRNKHDQSWIHEQKRRRNLRFQGLFHRIQCFNDANGAILNFAWIWTNKNLYIVEKQQPDHHQWIPFIKFKNYWRSSTVFNMLLL